MKDIEKLEKIIDEIDVLIDRKPDWNDYEFKSWYYKAKLFLKDKYGEESFEYRNFKNISFSKPFHIEVIPHLEFGEVCIDDLRITKEIFMEYRSILLNSHDEDNENFEKAIERIFTHYKKVYVQLSRRHESRETLQIKDEYDVQDLLRSLLSLYFDDIRSEEWTPSYAGSSVRMDFLIPEIKTVIEVKKTRASMTDKTLSEELIVDIEKYQNHPDCDKIYCFVYDPDTILRNPAAIKKDLEGKHEGVVKVYIEV